VGIAHFDEAPSREYEQGHLRGRWTFLGEAAGSLGIGVRRIQVPSGGWSTPAHEHGLEEEIFYVLSGTGLSWQKGQACEVGPGDCIVYLANRGAHTLHALEALDVLAFGPRAYDESVGFPRLGMSLLGRRAVESAPSAVDGVPVQFAREAVAGPPELPDEPGPRPSTIVNVEAVEARPVERDWVGRVRRNLGRAAGSVRTGLQHVVVTPGKESAPLHCHSLEEELFVILDGDGMLVLDDRDVAPVGRGHVVSCLAGTGESHLFRAGNGTLTYLAYGPRENGDICYYPRSRKLNFGGVGVIARIETLDYWDGED
jgi:uncharacterized cupin superfamily protein